MTVKHEAKISKGMYGSLLHNRRSNSPKNNHQYANKTQKINSIAFGYTLPKSENNSSVIGTILKSISSGNPD